jgi:hypothetical protein
MKDELDDVYLFNLDIGDIDDSVFDLPASCNDAPRHSSDPKTIFGPIERSL